MANPRPKILSAAFAMLAAASILLIVNEGAVSANAWALLALSGVFAAGAVMVFFQPDDNSQHPGSNVIHDVSGQQTAVQALPDPSEDGFDIPVV